MDDWRIVMCVLGALCKCTEIYKNIMEGRKNKTPLARRFKKKDNE